MHSSRELRSSSFEVRVDGRPAGIRDLFEGFGEQDRLGVVMTRPCGAVGASALITATITAFYDFHRARGDEFFVYPDHYLFHVGRPLGDHARLDVGAELAEAEAGAPGASAGEADGGRRPGDAASSGAAPADALRARIASIESRLGEVERDVRMRVLRERSELLRDGVPVETYRRIGLDEALGLLGSPTPAVAG